VYTCYGPTDLDPNDKSSTRMARSKPSLVYHFFQFPSFFPAGLDPSDKEQYEDGTHLTRAGQRVWLECMRPAVQPLLAGNATAAA